MAQGYSKLNNGYGEEPGVNWGRVAAYGVGGAAAYGVIRAGAMKGKKMAGPAFRNGKAIGGGILGMQMKGGWKGYAQLGAGQEATQAALAARNNQIRALGAQSRQHLAAAAALPAPVPRANIGKQAAANGLNDARYKFANRQKDLRHARATRNATLARDTTNMRLNDVDEARNPFSRGIARHNLNQQLGREALATEKMQAAAIAPHMAPSGHFPEHRYGTVHPSPVGAVASPRPAQNQFMSKIKGLRSQPLDTMSHMTRAEQHISAAKGFFGAMDYAGAGGWKQFGVGAARVGGALGAVGLGMKALSALNPFSD